jgi:hypothetical protein
MTDVDKLIEKGIAWTEQPFDNDPENGHDARGFIGTVDDLRIVVVSFDIADQGSPPKSRGHDGTVMGGSTILRLTRDQAKRLCEDAEIKTTK